MQHFRICKKCNEEKSIEDFSKSKDCKLGRRYTCKKCWNKKYVPKGPCKQNSSWFKTGHSFIGGEKGWIKKKQRLSPTTEFKKGQIPHNFIDGKSNEIAKKSTTKKYLRIRLEVLMRDGFKCRNCLNHNDILHVHHMIPRRMDAQKWCDKENLMTVCPKCHVNLDKDNKKKLLTEA